MSETPLFEVSVAEMREGEWQGSVYFPATGEREDFQSLMELIRTVAEHGGVPARPEWKRAER